MVDPVSRSAARLAAVIAIPVAILVGVGTFALLKDAWAEPDQPTDAVERETDRPVPTGPVPMSAPNLTEEQQVACRALLAQLPAELAGLPQRPVSDGPEQNAAYGEPAVTIACGVDPVEYELTDRVYAVSGVCWFADQRPEATVLTTLDRRVPVRVTVPAADELPPGQRVAEISPTIVESLRSTDDAPSGCSA